MRVSWRSRVFEIEGMVNRDERRRALDLIVIERDAP
jgi:head-tail adaptor